MIKTIADNYHHQCHTVICTVLHHTACLVLAYYMQSFLDFLKFSTSEVLVNTTVFTIISQYPNKMPPLSSLYLQQVTSCDAVRGCQTPQSISRQAVTQCDSSRPLVNDCPSLHRCVLVTTELHFPPGTQQRDTSTSN